MRRFGIGNAIAVNLASRGLPVLAVARSAHKLQDLAATFSLSVKPVSADLATDEGLDTILSSIEPNTVISGLVHSAGSRIAPESFTAIDTDALLNHFRVHVTSQIQLTQRLLQKASVRRILFIDSYSASQPRNEWGGVFDHQSGRTNGSTVCDARIR